MPLTADTDWKARFPQPAADGHKYDRGCTILFAGAEMTGAARLAASAAARIGSGLTIVVSPPRAGAIYRTALPAHVIVEDLSEPAAHIVDDRRNAIVIGPGGGGDIARTLSVVIDSRKACVIDADALTALAEVGPDLRDRLHGRCVLTPHGGEFARLFPDIEGGPLEKASRASELTGAVVVLKGRETAIAGPGRQPALVDGNAPYLATAGTGDVLSGMIGGLLAQGMHPFDAARAAASIHRAIGQRAGIGLVASDLPDMIPFVLKDMFG